MHKPNFMVPVVPNNGLVELTKEEQKKIHGVAFWGLAARVAGRVLLGVAAVGTGTAVAIGVGLLAYEIYCAFE